MTAPGYPSVELIAVLVDDASTKWSGFCRTLEFKKEVPLHERIEMFAIPWMEFGTKKAPMASPTILWAALLDGIQRSGTHRADEILAARQQLQRKYATPKADGPIPAKNDLDFIARYADWGLALLLAILIGFASDVLRWSKYSGPDFGYHHGWLSLFGLWLLGYWIVCLARMLWNKRI